MVDMSEAGMGMSHHWHRPTCYPAGVMIGMAGVATCKTLTLAKEAFSCYLQILSLSFSWRPAVFSDFYMDIYHSVYVAGVGNDIHGLHVPCLQKFFKNMKTFSSLYNKSKTPVIT